MSRRSDRLSVEISGMTVGTLGRSEEKQRDSVFSYGAVVAAENAVSLTTRDGTAMQLITRVGQNLEPPLISWAIRQTAWVVLRL
jgi:hypothetical protein